MASARVLGFDYVPSYPARGFGRFGLAGWYRNPWGGLSQVPGWIESVTVKLPNGNDPPQYEGYWYNSPALWVRIKPTDDRPYLVSISSPDDIGIRYPGITVWDAAITAPLSPTLVSPRRLNGSVWCRLAVRGEVAIEVKPQPTGEAVVREVLFDPWPEATIGVSPNFVGHGVF